MHQNSVDTYLEDIILASMDNTADRQAREEIQLMAERINEVAYEMEDRSVWCPDPAPRPARTYRAC